VVVSEKIYICGADMIKFFRLFLQKKWWNLLLLGLMNNVIFVLIFSLAFFYILPATMRLMPIILLLIFPFALLVWGLSNISLSRFFFSTLLFIATFILGFPLFTPFYERLYPDGIYGSGSSLASFLFLFLYIAMSFIAWITALILTLKARKRNDIPKDTGN